MSYININLSLWWILQICIQHFGPKDPDTVKEEEVCAVGSPDWLRGVAPRHFLLDGNLFPFEVEAPVKTWGETEQNREQHVKSGRLIYKRFV